MTGEPPAPAPPTDPRLAQPVTGQSTEVVLTPSRATWAANAIDEHETQGPGKLRGTVIHRMLDRLTSPHQPAPADRGVLLGELAREFGRGADDAEFAAWWTEACTVVDAPEWRELFDPRCYRTAYNEVPLSYVADGRSVHGVVDRLVIREEEIIVIDYKTHAGTVNPAQLADRYSGQLRLYAMGAARLWPGHTVRSLIVFTHIPTCHIVEDGRIGH